MLIGVVSGSEAGGEHVESSGRDTARAAEHTLRDTVRQAEFAARDTARNISHEAERVGEQIKCTSLDSSEVGKATHCVLDFARAGQAQVMSEQVKGMSQQTCMT